MTIWTRRKTAQTILDVLQDSRLLGGLPCFAKLDTWTNWIVFLKATYGLSMTSKDEKVFCQFTGHSRYRPPKHGYPEAVAIVGRQAGKDRIGSAVQAYEAITAKPQADRTELYALSIAQDQRSSLRTAFRYATAPFDVVPTLAQTVINKRANDWALNNGVMLASYPCRPEAIRGLRACVIVASELAFFRNSENQPTDTEMLRAARPCLATTGGRLLILSSPYGQAGALWNLHRKHYGRDDASVLIWQASAPDMNPTLPADYLERMKQDDPEAYRSEVLGEFRQGLTVFFDPDAVLSCVADGMREHPPVPGQSYYAFTDPASGSGQDRFAVALAHPEGERLSLDVVRAWNPPFNPSGVIAEAAALLKAYGCYSTRGDKYAPGFVKEGFASHNIRYDFSEKDRSALYLECLPLVNAQQAVLLDLPDLIRELRGLERHRGPSGRDRVDHAPGQHDDQANCACGALLLASQAAHQVPFAFYSGGRWIGAVPPPAPVEARPKGRELLNLLPHAVKFGELEEQQAHTVLQAEEGRWQSPVEREVRRTGIWWPRR